jgi:Na+-translocating ferredoxin:NAD+ oxidoreductase RnfE subunit
MLPTISGFPLFVLEGIMGVVLGISQWFVLKKSIPKAGLWIMVNGLGMAVTSIVISLLQQALGRSGLYVSPDATNPTFWAIAIVGTIFYAILTGSFFFWSLHQRTDNSG